MTVKHFITLQLFIFLLIVLFGIFLLAGWINIPTGPEGEWFTRIWELVLLVGNFAGLSTVVKSADKIELTGKTDEPAAIADTELKTTSAGPQAG